jgi:hypothetical protein
MMMEMEKEKERGMIYVYWVNECKERAQGKAVDEEVDGKLNEGSH